MISKIIFTSLLVSSIFYSCKNPIKKNSKLYSPSGLYTLNVEINNNKKDTTKYSCVKLTLLDKNNKSLASLQTDASDRMKWAVSWHPSKDIVILNSSDIGIYAWEITYKNAFQSLPVNKEFIALAEKSFIMKYND